MRLIDADALEIRDVSPAYGMVVMGVTINDIDDAPTVDAITVEWIKQRMLNVEDTMLGVAYSVLISEWEDEQAERKEE